jgi:NAD/NADP transhydrogenase beta subunit
VTCTIGLSISSLAGLVATVLTFFEYKKKDNDLSSAKAHDNVFVIQYLCVAIGSLGSLVAFGLQLSYMVEVDPEITFQKCFSGVFAGLS